METIFILHGWAVRGAEDNKKMWQPFIDQLKKNNFKVNFLKIPGLSAPLNEVWDLDNYLNWLDNEIAEKSAGQKIILLGHSFGGQLSIKFTATNSLKVKKLILLDSSGIKDMSLKSVLKRTVFLIISKLGKLVFRGEFFRNFLYKLAREADYKNASPLLRKTMANVLNQQITTFLPEINCPTLVLWGEFDKTTPVKNAFKMNKLIDKSKLVFIKNGRHSPQFTHPIETANEVIKFVANS